MTVPIRENLCSPSMYYLKCPFTTTKDGICVHNTGMPSPARNEISYMIRNDQEVSFHVAVDETEVVIGIPFTRNVWGSGDGRGSGNMHKIQIEICRSTNDNETLFRQAEKNAAWYIAKLLKENGWGIDRVFKHQDFDGKYCPHKTLDWGWTRFLNMIKAEMEPPKEEEKKVTYEEFKGFMNRYLADVENDKSVSEWAKEGWENCVNAGLLDGTMPKAALTREQFATVLNRIESQDKKEG